MNEFDALMIMIGRLVEIFLTVLGCMLIIALPIAVITFVVMLLIKTLVPMFGAGVLLVMIVLALIIGLLIQGNK